MKKLLVLPAMLLGLFAAPAMADEISISPEFEVTSTTSAYSGRKDKAYWTRVWYQKQAAKGRFYKKKRYTSKKRRSYKKRNRNAGLGRTFGTGSGRVLAKVDISQQRMNVYRGGRHIASWPVSTGRKGYGTPTGTWKIHRMHKEYYSKKYDNAPMPYAMFYHRGFAVHGTGSISRLGRTASHGCVRLHPRNAAKLFSMVRKSGGTVKVTY